MNTHHEAERPTPTAGFRGHDVVDASHRLIGTISDVVYDSGGDPEWAVVDLGLLRSSHFLPIAAGYMSEAGEFVVPPAYGELARCTECLACLAGCASFDLEDGSFGGPLSFVKLAQLHFDPRDGQDRRAQARALGVTTCLSCKTKCSCPVGVPIYRTAIEPLL